MDGWNVCHAGITEGGQLSATILHRTNTNRLLSLGFLFNLITWGMQAKFDSSFRIGQNLVAINLDSQTLRARRTGRPPQMHRITDELSWHFLRIWHYLVVSPSCLTWNSPWKAWKGTRVAYKLLLLLYQSRAQFYSYLSESGQYMLSKVALGTCGTLVYSLGTCPRRHSFGVLRGLGPRAGGCVPVDLFWLLSAQHLKSKQL